MKIAMLARNANLYSHKRLKEAAEAAETARQATREEVERAYGWVMGMCVFCIEINGI